jgi:hypothetical protein
LAALWIAIPCVSNNPRGKTLAQGFNGSFEPAQLRNCREEMLRRGSFGWPLANPRLYPRCRERLCCQAASGWSFAHSSMACRSSPAHQPLMACADPCIRVGPRADNSERLGAKTLHVMRSQKLQLLIAPCICSRVVSLIYPCPGCAHVPGAPVHSLPGRSTATLGPREHNKSQPRRRGCISPSW